MTDAKPAVDIVHTVQADLDTIMRYINIVLDRQSLSPMESHYLVNARHLCVKVRSTVEDI